VNSVERNVRQVGNRQTTSRWRQLLISRVRVAKRRNEASSKRTIAAGNSSFKPSWNTEKLRESSSPSDWNQKKGRMNRTPTSYSARDVQTQ
jgi:hypothetical protein